MERKSFINLLIVSVVFGQGYVVSSGASEGPSSALLIREKRASSSSGAGGQKRKYSPDHPVRETRIAPPPRWNKPLLTGMVKIYHGNREVGIGVVAHPRVFVTKAHFFRPNIQPGQYHVEYRGEDGMTISHDVIRAKANLSYKENKERPWGPHDVCFADTDGDMPRARVVSPLLRETGIFTLEQILWIGSRTACIDAPDIYDV